MGIKDMFRGFRKATANPSAPVPLPFNQSRDTRFAGGYNGQLISALRRILPGSYRDWSAVAGDLGLNSVVAVGIDWYIRNFPQAIPQVVRAVDSNQVEVIVDHPAIKLLREPSPGITSSVFWGWILQDYKLFGNAYIRKIRPSRVGEPIYLQYLPQDMVRPVGDGTNPITHYVYTKDGVQYSISVEDLIHMRYGRDPDDLRIGRSPVMSVLREIAADNEASTAAYGLLVNGAMPSLLVGPDSKDQVVDISREDAEIIKSRLREDLTGDGAGGIVVMTGPYKMERVSLSPSELALDSLRRVPEERICSALGLNPMVLGLGSGLERSTYSNYEAAQEAAWQDGMVPLLRALEETLSVSLLPDFIDTQEGDKLSFDLSGVRALSDDIDALSVRAERLYKAGICSLAEAKRLVGLEATDQDEVTLHPSLPAKVEAQQGESVADLNDKANIAGVLVRAGFDPAATARFLGLNIPHTGAEPVTLRDDTTKSIEVMEDGSVSVKYRPNSDMVTAARQALEWKKDGKRGGTRIGITRANQIVNGDVLSEDVILRMFAFFSRHEVDKEAPGFARGSEGYPSPGRVAWNLWGGDAGYAWSKRMREKIMQDRKSIPVYPEDYTYGSDFTPDE